MAFDTLPVVEYPDPILRQVCEECDIKDKSLKKLAKQIAKTMYKNNGCGIAEEDCKHIFDKFYQSDCSRKDEGSGLGLAISKEFVEAHGGTIEATSELGRGSVFTLTFAPAPELNGQNAVDIPSLS